MSAEPWWTGAWYEDPDGVRRLVPKPIPWRQAMRNILLNAMAYTNGNTEQAAKALEVSYRVLRYQLTINGLWYRHATVPSRSKAKRSPHVEKGAA